MFIKYNCLSYTYGTYNIIIKHKTTVDETLSSNSLQTQCVRRYETPQYYEFLSFEKIDKINYI